MSEPQTPLLLDGLSPLEETVVDAARRGTSAEPAARLEAKHLAATNDPGLRVRARLIRELLMGCRGELDPRGVVLFGVQVVGKLDLDHVAAVTSLGLVNCALPDEISCIHARFHQLNLAYSVFANGFDARGVRTDGSLFLYDVHIIGSGKNGALCLEGAQVGDQLNLERATITNTSGPALNARGIRIDRGMLLDNTRIAASGEDSALMLRGARVGGDVSLEDATITNTTGPALNADGLRTDGQLSLRDACITGTSEEAAVRLLVAHIGGQLNLHRTTITNTVGPGLAADSIRTDEGLSLTGAHISGGGEIGALRLAGAHIGGAMDLREVQLTNESGPLLVLVGAQVEGLLLFGTLICRQARWDYGGRFCRDYARELFVQGLVFRDLGGISWQEWLHLLVHHTYEYFPQPYQQLAAVERAAGHDNNARYILIAQQDDLRRRSPQALGGWLAQRRHWLWGWLGRYGYRAHRLVTALLTVLLLSGAAGYIAGQVPSRAGHHAAERVQKPTTPATAAGTPCSTAELIGLGIDRGLPLGATGLRARCDLDTTTRRGQAFTYLLWALQALLWALATLTIAAYTGLIRKTA